MRYITDKSKYNEYIRYFNDRLVEYFPRPDDWTPVDEALFSPDDLYDIPLEKARQMQFDAICFSFSHHYTNNELFRSFCKNNNVSPQNIKNPEDLYSIPLIPDAFFKNYPCGRPFATWLGNLYTGKLPQIIIRQKNPSLDQIIEAFNSSGLYVTYSSGTGGRYTIIPRDKRTFNNSQYAIAKSMLGMSFGRWIYNSSAYLMMPDPRINNIFAGKASQVFFDIVSDARVAINQKLTISFLNTVMNNKGGIKTKVVRLASNYKSHRIIETVIDWLDNRQNSQEFTFILGAPYMIYHVLQKLKQRGKSYHFGERGGVVTGGGWKIYEHQKLPIAEFRKLVETVLGIPGRYCLDVYGMVEGNSWMIQCPEGHYLHVPYSYFKPMVLDDNLKPMRDGEWGRFAFLDASAFSYPGFILTGDKAKLLPKCPVCDRPGPVLEPEISRIAGQEGRGCSDEVRRIFVVNRQL